VLVLIGTNLTILVLLDLLLTDHMDLLLVHMVRTLLSHKIPNLMVLVIIILVFVQIQILDYVFGIVAVLKLLTNAINVIADKNSQVDIFAIILDI
jgi:hypothetical protein